MFLLIQDIQNRDALTPLMDSGEKDPRAFSALRFDTASQRTMGRLLRMHGPSWSKQSPACVPLNFPRLETCISRRLNPEVNAVDHRLLIVSGEETQGLSVDSARSKSHTSS